MADAVDEGRLLLFARALRDTGYAFTTPTPATHARVNARPENARARGATDIFGWSRAFIRSSLPEPLFVLAEAAGILRVQGDSYASTVRVSSLGPHLFVHSAHPTTDAASVFFGPDTYRFAHAIRAGLEGRTGAIRRAADIGCGAGPGGILVAAAAEGASVALADINETALSLARVNAALAGTANVETVRSDLFGALEGEFDLVVANPPYLLDPAIRAYRHGGGDYGEGLSLAILDGALPRLARGGTLILYTGVAIVDGWDRVRSRAAERLRGADIHWTYAEIDPDVFGEELDQPAYRDCDRIAAVVLTVTRLG